jgi:hypothetical protein
MLLKNKGVTGASFVLCKVFRGKDEGGRACPEFAEGMKDE